ncbi:MAG: hypothetical protein KC492_43055 [Myxococcales bacterium]|nr:hypothetical protein [Myxococcales bacterium]MCB9607306.1 hypothetical protein [Polyangiaceae bacterium]
MKTLQSAKAGIFSLSFVTLALFAPGCSDSDGGGSGGVQAATASLCNTYCARLDDCGLLQGETQASCRTECSNNPPPCTPTDTAVKACGDSMVTAECSVIANATPECQAICEGSGTGGNGNGGGNGGGSSSGCAAACANFVACGEVEASMQSNCVAQCEASKASAPSGCDVEACATAFGGQSCTEVSTGVVPNVCVPCQG